MLHTPQRRYFRHLKSTKLLSNYLPEDRAARSDSRRTLRPGTSHSLHDLLISLDNYTLPKFIG
jgi:hypothetical protein